MAVAEEDVARKVLVLGREARHARCSALAAGVLADACICTASARLHIKLATHTATSGSKVESKMSPFALVPGPDGVPCLLPPAQALVTRATVRVMGQVWTPGWGSETAIDETHTQSSAAAGRASSSSDYDSPALDSDRSRELPLDSELDLIGASAVCDASMSSAGVAMLLACS